MTFGFEEIKRAQTSFRVSSDFFLKLKNFSVGFWEKAMVRPCNSNKIFVVGVRVWILGVRVFWVEVLESIFLKVRVLRG